MIARLYLTIVKPHARSNADLEYLSPDSFAAEKFLRARRTAAGQAQAILRSSSRTRGATQTSKIYQRQKKEKGYHTMLHDICVIPLPFDRWLEYQI